MLHIPEDFTQFLYWVKERTEAFWQRPPATSETEYDCEEWMRGARWQPLSEAEIDAVEARYGVQFIPEHRAFLRVLHAIDRRNTYAEIRNEYDPETELYEEVTIHYDDAYFYNWLTDEAEIRQQLAWPYDAIIRDIHGLNRYWLPAWGPRPASIHEQEAIVARWYAEAPPLLPLTGKDFLVSGSGQPEHPVVSMFGFDTFINYWDLRTFLNESLLSVDMDGWVYDQIDQRWDWFPRPEVQQLLVADFRAAGLGKSLPYWKDLIMSTSTGWSSFGLEYPRPPVPPRPL